MGRRRKKGEQKHGIFSSAKPGKKRKEGTAEEGRGIWI